MAYAYMSLQPADTAGARTAATRALAINPDDSQAHIALARISLIQKQNDPAVLHYADASKFFLPARDAYLMGRVYEAKKELDKAGVAFRTAVSIDSTNKDYLTWAGSTALLAQDWEGAADAYERLHLVEPDNVSAVANLATAWVQTGKLTEAENLLKEQAKTHESSPEVQNALGDFYLKKGDKDLAKQAYQTALTLNPSPAIGTRSGEELGYMLWEANDFAGAVPVLKTSLRYNECNIRAVLTLANCYVKLNQTPDAINLLRNAQSCPNSEQVRQMLKALGG